jgi:hypothetical protein
MGDNESSAKKSKKKKHLTLSALINRHFGISDEN